MAEASFTIFSDANSPGWAEGFAELLREGSTARVEIVDSLDEALDGDAGVLILNLGRRDDEKLSAERIASLGRRRVIALAPGVDWLCAQLDEIEFRGSNVTADMTMRVVDSDLMGNAWVKEPIRPFKEIQNAPSEEWTPQTPRVYFCSGNVAEYRSGVDYVLVPEKLEECAVVMRHANFVFAGVRAHPDKWSEQYRALIVRVAMALARRPVEDLKPIIVERQIHPPGAVRFDLDPIAEQGTSHRAFYFRFERPTALTATLEHAGSNAMMLMFSGGKKHLHATRVDTEDGETMTITVNIGERAIRDLGHRYWSLRVQNFDRENPCSAKLTVRYDVADRTDSVRALPGNASLEYVNALAWNLLGAAQTDTSTRRQVATRSGSKEAIDLDVARLATAREHGFESWRDLESHLAWKPGFDMRGGTVGVDSFYARVKARYGETFTVEQLIEFVGDFTGDLHDTVTHASTRHRVGDHHTFSGKHLLLALLDNPTSAHAVKCVGVDIDDLGAELNALPDTLATNPPVGQGMVSKTVCGAVYRANFISALGREGTNAANLLAGLLGESCEATNILNGHGVLQRDIVNYVTHGIPRVVVTEQRPGASVLDGGLERATGTTFANARADRLRYVSVELFLLALLADPDIRGVLSSGATGMGKLREELGAFIDAASVVAGDDGIPQPTRAFNRVMQVAVAKARSGERDRATTLDALWALCGERDVPAAAFLADCGVSRTTVGSRIG